MAKPQEVAATGVVVGMRELTGEVHPRVDIDVLLVTQPDTFNLFLQALTGIHGLPKNNWDDVGKKFGDSNFGYCAHGVLIFPTWHRPYVSLVEQTIYLQMAEIAGKYDEPHRQKYLDAAKTFRLPYLDYFRPRDGKVEFPGLKPNASRTSFPYNFRLPDILNEEKIALRLPPNNELAYDIDNPLYTYKFSEANGQFSKSDQDYVAQTGYSTSQTVRHPANIHSTTHGFSELSDVLNSGREGRNSFALALIYSQPYGQFQTVASDSLAEGDITAFSSPTAGSGSLEGSIHGNYHVLIGGQTGHMGVPTLAAFDPVFWFHHCQVDRLWAFWQAFHPDEWFPKPQGDQLAEEQKDLLPFYKSRSGPGNGIFYNSDDSRETEPFGYIYDDFVGVSKGDTAILRKRIDDKYIWASRTPSHPQITDPPSTMIPLKVRATQFFSKETNGSANVSGRAADQIDSSTTDGNAIADQKTGESAGFAGAFISNAQSIMQSVPMKLQSVLTATAPNPPKIDSKFDREWYVDSVVNRAAANGPFTIFFFLSLSEELTTDPQNYGQSPYLAGINHIFAAPREVCSNCGDLEAAGQLATDTSPITPLLLDYLDVPNNGLASMRPEHVKPFLVKHLRWRVIYRGTDQQDPRDVPDLKVSVSAKIYHQDETKTFEVYPDVVAEILRNASPTAGA
ncbi:uncharacterized protein RSE6_10479 [Rhynchosporium secalis]|uniref:tyrosinase n=1 Tax=Rhynchosporium secalis TaxID=38038 RepID=A0A1E1MKL9_RHYSE|nr:uncharacterized protein RSE6_10479 [Rhynchosporium secalis]